jgi:hypothetical protein
MGLGSFAKNDNFTRGAGTKPQMGMGANEVTKELEYSYYSYVLYFVALTACSYLARRLGCSLSNSNTNSF